MDDLVDDFIRMNKAGLVLELCEKYYAADVVMLNNGTIFAESMRESYNKQKGFVESVAEFDVQLVSKVINDNISELTFQYRMISADSTTSEFTGKHIQTWQDNKIVREEYLSV